MKHSPSRMYAFTEQGVAMLSAVLKSDVAVRESIRIMNAFVACLIRSARRQPRVRPMANEVSKIML